MNGKATDAKQVIRSHIHSFWPDRRKEYFSWTLGPIGHTLPSFSVCRVSPNTPLEPWIYLSVGAWEVKRNEHFEFFLMSPTEEALHVETLAMVANFWADPRYELHVGKVLDIGRPWLEGSPCDHLLISLPYPFGPKLEVCRVSNEMTVRFLWLLPIHRSEAEFLREKGLEALERRFDECAIDYLDAQREPVI